jgi:glycosyltransferase involved in cell wall biosynthesis
VNKLKIIQGGSIGVTYHRLINPMTYFTDGVEIEVVKKVSIKDPDCRVLMYNVRGVNQSVESLLKIKAKGVRLWADIDDWIERPFWHLNRVPTEPYESKMILDYLRIADVITCSTKTLQNELKKQFKIESNIVHNAIDVEIERTDHDLSIGWIGGTNHHIDHSKLIHVMRNPYKAKRIIGGADNPNNEYWEYLDRVWSGDRVHHVEVLKMENIYNYMNLYKNIDIVLLPSTDDIYTRCKSNLKLLEAASVGLPIITSNLGAYSEIKDYHGLKCKDSKSWRSAIELLIRSERKRKEYAEGLKDYAKGYTMQKANLIRFEILKHL